MSNLEVSVILDAAQEQLNLENRTQRPKLSFIFWENQIPPCPTRRFGKNWFKNFSLRTLNMLTEGHQNQPNSRMTTSRRANFLRLEPLENLGDPRSRS